MVGELLISTFQSMSNATLQVHADASNFADGVSKQEAYEQVLLMAEGLCTGQRNWVWQLNQ